MRESIFLSLVFGGMICANTYAQINQVEKAPPAQTRNINPKAHLEDLDYQEDEDIKVGQESLNCSEAIQVEAYRSSTSQITQLIEDSEKVIRSNECQYFEDFVLEGVPVEALKQALKYYKDHKNKFKNQNFISIADYSQHSSQKRFYLLDMRTGAVKKYRVSHGSGKINGVSYGDPDHDGMINQCRFDKEQLQKINNIRKNNGQSPIHDRWAMTRPGFYKTEYLANSIAHDPANKNASAPWPMFSTSPRTNKMILDGLSPSVNDDSKRNGVVMHEAWYNGNDSKMGRSFGCRAAQPGEGREIVEKIKSGSLFYSYVPDCSDDMTKVEKQVPNWDKMCS